MIVEKEDEARLKKLKISSFLELALTIPQKYEDMRLDAPLVEGAFAAVHCEIISKHLTPKTLTYDLRLLSHNKGVIKAVFFSPKRYQQNIFSIGETLYLYGKISHYPYFCIVHPKKISSVAEINRIYTKGAANKTYKLLTDRHVNIQNLMGEGVDSKTAQTIVKLHAPTSLDELFFGTKLRDEFVNALKLCEIYSHLKTLFSKKIDLPAKPVKTAKLDTFFGALPYKLTNDQMMAIEHCKSDLEKNIQAKRVVIGDVGCGKTTVIMAIAQMSGNGKTALLAPTSILANQIYEEAKKYLKLKTVLVTQGSKASEDEIAKADFIIGTHALLYKKLPACASLIVDEQHRFGTNQRHLISKLVSSGKDRPHYFQFSATPIPRTQALIEASLADITMIKETPLKKNIETTIVSKENWNELFAHIKQEVKEGKQVALIYPLVEKSEKSNYMSIEEAEGFWKKHFEKVYVTHGGDDEKEEVFEAFKKDGQIIVATTVMEVGISLPKLSTVVIVGAEKLGLASLHQLRGRVARNTEHGWCYLFTKDTGNERLERFAATKSGFEIAELDLEFRDSGDLLSGKEQSGKRFRWFELKTDYEIAKEAKALLAGFLGDTN
jgi:ATP-dependent DNA helicase RecG